MFNLKAQFNFHIIFLHTPSILTSYRVLSSFLLVE